MNNNTNNSDIPEELIQLVPWYATGKLSDKDQAFFEDALVDYPLLQTHLKQELEMIEIVSADKTLLNKSAIAPTEERLKAVFNVIDADQKSHHKAQRDTASILDKLKSALNSLLSNKEGVPQYARIASVTAVVVSLAVLSAFVAPIFTSNNDYIPASATIDQEVEKAQTTATDKTVLLVGFKGKSVELGNNKVLQGKLSKIESVPNKEGIYQISFKRTLSPDEIKETIEALLLQKDVIWFAGEEY